MRIGPGLRRGCALAPLLLAAGATLGQGLPPVQRSFPDGSTLRVYGQIGKGVLGYDDGIETETYALVDNNNANTQFGLAFTRRFGAWTFQNVNEFQYGPYSTADVNLLHRTFNSVDRGLSNDNIRKLDFTLENARRGKLWLGQGNMATDGVMEHDLSGTAVIAYSSVGNSAAGQILRFSAPGLSFEESLSGIQIGDVYANYDGDRRVRVRWDTPAVRGFTLAASFGRDLLSDDAAVRDANVFDAAVSYAGTLGAVEVSAGLGYFRSEDRAEIVGGSASAIHRASGLSLSLAAARQDLEGEGDDGSFWYAKLGLKRDYLAWGTTAASVDRYAGEDIFLDAARGITSSTSDSWGLALVQEIERANTQLWLTWREYDYADDAARYHAGRAIFAGANFQF